MVKHRNIKTYRSILASLLILLITALALGNMDLWSSHFSSATLAQAIDYDLLGFWPLLWVDHVEAFWAAGMGILLLIRHRDWSRKAFPLVWFLTVTIIHLHHRPWCPYYYLYFAVPLAWLSGYGKLKSYVLPGKRSWPGLGSPTFDCLDA